MKPESGCFGTAKTPWAERRTGRKMKQRQAERGALKRSVWEIHQFPRPVTPVATPVKRVGGVIVEQGQQPRQIAVNDRHIWVLFRLQC